MSEVPSAEPNGIVVDTFVAYKMLGALRGYLDNLEAGRGKGPGDLVTYDPLADAIQELVAYLESRLPMGGPEYPRFTL